MEDLQTDTLSTYEKHQPEVLDSNKEDENRAVGFLNGCDEIDTLDLMDHCENQSIGSNSDVWKGSDSDDEPFGSNESCTNSAVEKITNCEDINISAKDTSECDSINEDKDMVKNDTQNQAECTLDPPVQDQDQASVTQTESKLDPPVQDQDHMSVTQTECIVDPPVQDQDQLSVTQTECIVAVQDQDKPPVTQTECIVDPPVENQDKPPVTQTECVLDPPVENQDQTPVTQTECELDLPVENPQNSIAVENTDAPLEDLQECSATNSSIQEAGPSVSASLYEEPTPGTSAECEIPQNQSDTTNNEPNVLMDYDDDDFDPSLLCPEVSMAVDDNPVITTNSESSIIGEGCVNNVDSSSGYVHETTDSDISFNLTEEEQLLRKRYYGRGNPIQKTRIHCTACNVHLGSALDMQGNRFVHPMLKVLICKQCYHFYTSGEFDKDEDGSELYCRWCGQGGQVLCCSKCEFVFCKRCIRTNFSRKKMNQIRDSDSWECFRCNPSQIMSQRVSCFEFFEYIRREISRAATLDSPEVWSKDHSFCCVAKKRALESGDEVKKTKRKKEVDPDFTPDLVFGNNVAPSKGYIINKPVQLDPALDKTDNDIEFVQQIQPPTTTFVAPNAPQSLFRSIVPAFPKMIQLGLPTLQPVRLQPPPLVPTANKLVRKQSVAKTKTAMSPAMIKREWFEKTVVAAARVNSHLSYTLTQLNKAYAQASMVEELAVVHNKLQEILSSSVNSLIQIRKNLRAEFIASIRTSRPEPKKRENDDDVIIVSAPAFMSAPSTSQTVLKNALTAPPKQQYARKGFLKVKSMKDLQNVTAECITIPDDPPEQHQPTPMQDATPAGDNIDLITSETDNTAVSEDAKIGEKLPKTKSDVAVKQETSNVVSEAEMKRMTSVHVRVVREDLKDLQERLKH